MPPMSFWKTTQQFTELMRKLASFVFQLKGHAAPVETLFSSLSYSKPNQEQDDDRQSQTHWINLQVTGRQHPHLLQERHVKGQDSWGQSQ